MSPDISQAVAAFALAAVPGVIVLEILEYGRPPIRERSNTRAFALYLILSLLTWGLAVVFLDASGRLADLIDAGSGPGQRLVDGYIALAWRLAATAIGVGVASRFGHIALSRYAFRATERIRLGKAKRLSRFDRIAANLVSVVFAWDDLLARLRRKASPQLVHVRFRDGAETYGVLAAGGRADFQADGRGLVLDAELIEQNGELVQLPGSSGVFVAPDAIASVSFLEYVAPPEDRNAAGYNRPKNEQN